MVISVRRITFIMSFMAAVPLLIHALKVGKISDARNVVSRNGGCNSSICFAVAGSSSLTPAQFSLQKDLVATVTKVLQGQGDVKLAAVQYGFITSSVSGLTKDTKLFLERVEKSVFENDNSTFLGGAIAYCDLELFAESPRNLVVIGDGRSNVSDPVQDANIFRERGGQIFAVTVGTPDMETIRDIVAGELSYVFDVDDSKGIDAAVVALVEGLCEIGSS